MTGPPNEWGGADLLQSATEEQDQLLRLVMEGRGPYGWPVFQWVEGEMYSRHESDATAVIYSMPEIRSGQGQYGWIDRMSGWRPHFAAGERVGLTVAALSRLEGAGRTIAEDYVLALACLTEMEREVQASPDRAVKVTVEAGTLAEKMRDRAQGRHFAPEIMRNIGDLIPREPGTQGCAFLDQAPHMRDGLTWRVELTPFIRGYSGITNVQDYILRIEERLIPPAPRPEPRFPSSLSLAEAIDFTNAVWRLKFRAPLLRISKAEAAAKLVLDCSTFDEFDSRISALYVLLDNVYIPGSDNSKLFNLEKYLAQALSDEAGARVVECVQVLRAVIALRTFRMHSGGEEKLRRAQDKLGLELPADNWNDAWRTVRARCVEALAGIREEVDAALPDAASS